MERLEEAVRKKLWYETTVYFRQICLSDDAPAVRQALKVFVVPSIKNLLTFEVLGLASDFFRSHSAHEEAQAFFAQIASQIPENSLTENLLQIERAHFSLLIGNTKYLPRELSDAKATEELILSFQRRSSSAVVHTLLFRYFLLLMAQSRLSGRATQFLTVFARAFALAPKPSQISLLDRDVCLAAMVAKEKYDFTDLQSYLFAESSNLWKAALKSFLAGDLEATTVFVENQDNQMRKQKELVLYRCKVFALFRVFCEQKRTVGNTVFSLPLTTCLSACQMQLEEFVFVFTTGKAHQLYDGVVDVNKNEVFITNTKVVLDKSSLNRTIDNLNKYLRSRQ